MSASERLAALDAAMTTGPWRANEKWESSLTVGGVHSFTGRMRTPEDAVSVAALANALPEIVAVVRILECRHGDPDNSGLCIYCHAVLDEGNPWDAALAALEEKLDWKAAPIVEIEDWKVKP